MNNKNKNKDKAGCYIDIRQPSPRTVEIVKIRCLPMSRLPPEYLSGLPRFETLSDGSLECETTVDMRRCRFVLKPGQLLPTEVFDEYLAVLKAAGERLHKINHERLRVVRVRI